MPILPILLIVGGAGLLVYLSTTKFEDTPPVHEPDLPTAPKGKTRWPQVNAILGELQKAAESSGIPLGVLVSFSPPINKGRSTGGS